jgi:LacI family transcriptional regulator
MANHVLNAVQPPTALFAGNNFIAIGILWAIKDLNLRVPQDISLVSFDDLPFDPVHEPFVTVAAQDPYQLGVSAAERLIEQVFDQNADAALGELILPVEILIRKSCRAI